MIWDGYNDLVISEVENDQKLRAAEAFDSFEKELDTELSNEERKYRSNMANLEKRKEEMIQDKEKKLQVGGIMSISVSKFFNELIGK